tara:strand:- start:2635 stop:3141 length:507 start_codon:yes stop_codon:yes gene_type:complete
MKNKNRDKISGRFRKQKKGGLAKTFCGALFILCYVFALVVTTPPIPIAVTNAQEPQEPQVILIGIKYNWTEERITQEINTVFGNNPTMVRIAKCESAMMHEKEGKVVRGKVDPDDTGLMQINKRYHEKHAKRLGLNLEDIKDNITFAKILFDQSGTTPWSASKKCWSL